jgi:hypothetical protein
VTTLEHDGAASLAVKYFAGGGWREKRDSRPGWYVARICPCHHGETITVPFESRGAAECALKVLDEDAQKYDGH